MMINILRRREIQTAVLILIVATFSLSATYGAGIYVGKLLTTLTGTEVFNDQSNPTGAGVTSKVLMTQGLAGAAKTTVAALPTCNTAAKGYTYEVTDASSPTYGGTLTGSSTTFALAICDGTNWTAH